MNHQRISVIVPVYNGERFLAEAIQSVLAQTVLPHEIIVVDDGSTDRSPGVAAKLAATSSVPIRYVAQPNQGPAATRNHGLRLATGDLLAFIDADDLWDRNKLATQTAYLNAHDETLIVWSMLHMFEVRDGNVFPIATPWHGPYLGSALFQRMAFELVGPFDETMRLGEDLDWYLRASERGVPQSFLPDIALWYRKHDHNVCLGKPHVSHPMLGSIKKHLDRIRNSSPRRES